MAAGSRHPPDAGELVMVARLPRFVLLILRATLMFGPLTVKHISGADCLIVASGRRNPAGAWPDQTGPGET
jgi:hypothetical protein